MTSPTPHHNLGQDTTRPWPGGANSSLSPRTFANKYPISDPGDLSSPRESPTDQMFGTSEAYELVLEAKEESSPAGSMLSTPNCKPERRLPSPLSTSPSASVRSSHLFHSNHSSFASDQRFKIRNTDTGEEIDLRDENQTDFAQQLAQVLSSSQQDLQEYWYLLSSTIKRRNNEALWEAIKGGNERECRELLKWEKWGELTAQVSAKGLDEWTALHLAASCGYSNVCEYLFQLPGIDLNLRTVNQRTPLHIAAISGQLRACELLLGHRADANAVDSEGLTALHHASALGLLSIVQCLLAAGANVALRTHMEKTCFELAGSAEVAEVIQKHCQLHGISTHVDSYGRTRLGGVLRHNSREDMIAKMLYKAANRTDPQALRGCFERGPVMANRSRNGSINSQPQSPMGKSVASSSGLIEISYQDFTPICVLGKGSFGEVFLVTKIDTGRQYAMKLLRKDKILGQHLLKYAMAERNIQATIRHPFIVRLRYAFQTPHFLALLLDFCPCGTLGDLLSHERK